MPANVQWLICGLTTSTRCLAVTGGGIVLVSELPGPHGPWNACILWNPFQIFTFCIHLPILQSIESANMELHTGLLLGTY